MKSRGTEAQADNTNFMQLSQPADGSEHGLGWAAMLFAVHGTSIPAMSLPISIRGLFPIGDCSISGATISHDFLWIEASSIEA